MSLNKLLNRIQEAQTCICNRVFGYKSENKKPRPREVGLRRRSIGLGEWYNTDHTVRMSTSNCIQAPVDIKELTEAIKELDDGHKLLFALYMSGYEYDEISKRTRMSEIEAKTIIKHSIEKIMEKLER